MPSLALRWSSSALRARLSKSVAFSKTEALRGHIQTNGFATGAQLAQLVELDGTASVAALLRSDLKTGQVRYRAGKYYWNEDFDLQLQAELEAAASLLRRNGWRIAPPARATP